MSKNSLTTTDRGQVPAYDPDFDSGYGYEYPGAGNSESQKNQVFRSLAVLRRYWWLILGITLLTTTVVTVYEAQKPDLYQAEAKIQVNNEINPAVGAGPGGAIVLSQNTDPAYFTTQLRILEGSGLMRRVVKAIDLEHNDAFLNPSRGKRLNAWQNVFRMFGLYRPVQTANVPPVVTQNNGLELKHETEANLDIQAERLAPYVAAIDRGLDITPLKDPRTATKETRLIGIKFNHQDPVIAAKVANTIADIYVLQNLERKVESNASASEFLEKRVAELQNDIRTREERLLNYSKDNQILSLDAGQNTVVQRLGDLNSKLGAAESERISAEAAYRAAKQNPMSGVVAENTDPRTAGLQTQLTALKQQLAQLKTEYTDEWPEVQRVQKQIAQLETELQTNQKRAKDTQASLLEQNYREAAAKERELRSNFETQRNAVLAQNEAAINYRIIEQENTTNRALLDNLLQKSRETDVILNNTPNNVLVADRATIPKVPNDQRRATNILLALLGSLLFGVGLAFAANWFDDRIRVHDDVEAQVGLPVVGMIPGIYQGGLKRLFSSRRRLGSGKNGDAGLVPVDFERPIVTEAFNQVRSSILLSNGDTAPNTILVTSGLPNEGKTLTSLNLAKGLAQLGGKVLLIDGDLRCPKMHLINGVNNEKGLSRLLAAGNIPLDSLDDTIIEGIGENLDLMTAGPAAADPSTLLSLVRMRNVLKRLGTFYKYIVIDSPPVLYFADSVMLANIVDSVLIVGRMNFSSSELLALTKRKLQSVNPNIVGVVLNDVPLKNYGYKINGYYVNDIEIEHPNGNGNGNGHSNGNGNGRVLDI